MAYRAMWAHLVVVSAPILQLFGRIRKRQEPVRVQAFCPEAAVEGFDEGIVRWLSRSREVERDASVTETRDWQFAVLPRSEAYCGAMPTE